MAVSALAPSYFKPRTVDLLVDCCAEIAAAAPGLPFYYYDIPALTGVVLPPREFLEKASGRIPNLAGLKFTNPDLMAYLQCLRAGDWDIPWGLDEWMLGALATGARGAVGSSFNFAAPLYLGLMAAFERGILRRRGGAVSEHAADRAAGAARIHGRREGDDGVLGVDVGPARLPNASLSAEQARILRGELEALGFFGWIA